MISSTTWVWQYLQSGRSTSSRQRKRAWEALRKAPGTGGGFVKEGAELLAERAKVFFVSGGVGGSDVGACLPKRERKKKKKKQIWRRRRVKSVALGIDAAEAMFDCEKPEGGKHVNCPSKSEPGLSNRCQSDRPMGHKYNYYKRKTLLFFSFFSFFFLHPVRILRVE